MKITKPRSLRWRLTARIIITQITLIFILSFLQLFIEAKLWSSGIMNDGVNPWAAVNSVSESVIRDQNGTLRVEDTPQLRHLLKRDPEFWYVVRDGKGQQIQYGKPPVEIVSAASVLDSIAYADLGQNITKDKSPAGTIQWADSRAGEIKIMTTPNIPVTFSEALMLCSAKNIVTVIFLSIIIIIVMLLITPWVLRKTLTGLNQAASDAKNIDYSQTGIRLKSRDVPSEIVPFIDAVNSAFDRLDKGVESQKRFLIDAAHELRTPITILNTRLSTLPAGPLKNKLLSDASRLTLLTGQLLDLHRLQGGNLKPEYIDLVKLAEHVVGDIAPLAIGAGYEISFETSVREAWVNADSLGIERALTNLIQNAIKYGGHAGLISICIGANGNIDVIDQGQGIPESERERVFEPFHRLINDGKGTGLGLDLVKKIMNLHGGSAELLFAEIVPCGAHFRLIFPEVKVVLADL